MNILHLLPGSDVYAWFTAELSAEPLRTQWWTDAESSVDDPADASYLVAVVDRQPAAWAGYVVDFAAGELRCCNNYIRRGHTPDLYEAVFRARHDQVVVPAGMPAVTYLFPEPIPLHLAYGWRVDVGPGAAGMSRPFPGGPLHRWQRMTWAPPQAYTSG